MALFDGIEDHPRSLRDVSVRELRWEMLQQEHMHKLNEFVVKLRNQNLGEVPYFDPLDGGTEAQVLFLLEKPGPMTSETGKRVGSGFVSRNNDDFTAEATFDFMLRAGIPRKSTVIWNLIPWWNGTTKINAKEMR